MKGAARGLRRLFSSEKEISRSASLWDRKWVSSEPTSASLAAGRPTEHAARKLLRLSLALSLTPNIQQLLSEFT